MNLLEKANIITTATAYDNGKLHSVKGGEVADFDVVRGSAATRVTAQGLVENVQILSSNLVQNPSFSEEGVQEVSNGSFSQEGVELVTNGSFDTDTDWSKGTGWSISGGKANATSSPSGQRLSQFNLGQTINRPYKITISVSNLTQGGFGIWLGGANTSLNINTNGNHTIYLTPINTAQLFIFTNGTTSGSIESVSIREVAQDWTLGTGWSIGEDKAISDTTASNLTPSTVLVSGKTYKFTLDVAKISAGSFTFLLRFNGSNTAIGTINSEGSFTFYAKADATGFRLQNLSGGTTDFSVTNISVKQVGMDWTLGTGWSIAENKAISDATQGYITQTDISGAGVTATYKTQWTQNITAGTRLRFFARNYNDGGNATTLSITRNDGTSMAGGNCIGSGTFTAYVSSTNGYSFKLLAEAGVEADITNITTIQITDDTNLPRISYENFSYQDALGSEQIVNGGFDDGSANWTVAGGNPIFENSSVNLVNFSTINSNNTVVEQGKTYKITYTISNKVGSSSFGFFLGGWNVAQYQDVGTHSEIISVSSSSVIYIRNGNSNSSVTIDNVSVKEYLGQEVVPNSGTASVLLESQSTNLIPYSEDFSQWAALDGTTAITYVSDLVNPDGSVGGYKISGSGVFLALGLLSTSERNIYARAVSGTGTAQLLSHNANTNNIFNLTEDWQRFNVNSAPSAAPSNFYIDLRGASSTLTELYVWGANATNDQDYPTSYIPTSGTIATRLADRVTGAGDATTFNSTEGVLYGEFSTIASDNNSNWINLSDGTAVNWLFVGRDFNKVRIYLRANNAVVLSDTTTTLANNNKVALSYKSGDIRAYINGVEVVNLTSAFSFTSALNTLNFGAFIGGDTTTQATWKALAVFNEALTDSELECLTKI